MKVHTSRFGEIEFQESEVFSLESGLIGFPELVRYVLLDHDKDSPFKWLQSVDDGTMAFVVIDPLTFHPNYVVDILEEDLRLLQIKGVSESVVFVIVTIPMDPKKMSANLKAPLAFNMRIRTGKQLVVKDTKYQTKHFIMEEIRQYSSYSPEQQHVNLQTR